MFPAGKKFRFLPIRHVHDSIYTNITYPHRNNPPFIQGKKGYTIMDEPNPVGSYRRDFNIPDDWKEVNIHF